MPELTSVEFEFYGPDGVAYKNKPFIIKLANAGFDKYQDGVILPDTIYASTDEFGKAIVPIMPSSTPYFVHVLSDKVSYNDCCVPDLARYKFYVPVSTEIVRAQDLFIEVPPSTTAYDEEAIRLITEAKASAIAAAIRSEASAVHAQEVAQSIEGDAQAAKEAAESALLSKDAAAASATEANASKVASKNSEDAAKLSETAAAQSATSASEDATEANSASNLAKRWASENENVVIADGKESSYSYSRKAATSASAASISASTASTQAGLATNAKNASEAAAVTATDKANVATLASAHAETEANRAEAEADRAAEYASAITGALIEAGSVNLSSNQYPPKPEFSSFWKVTVGGTVAGVDYGIGDTLVYSKTLDQFYKIDNTESVSSVNGKTGAVTLSKSDVGLSAVDNTSDANKPISSAQQTALDAKQASSTNLTAFAGLAGAADRLPYFTGAGALSLSVLTAKARLLLARPDTAGMQAELGLVPVTSTTDNTAGRLVTVGFNGLGGPLLNVQGTPAAVIARNAGATFSYLSANDKAPGMTADGALVTLGANVDYAFQMACDWRTGDLYSQYKGGGALSGWKRFMRIGDFGLGDTAGLRLPGGDANTNTLPSGRYATVATWTGSPFPGTDGRNQGYLEVHPWEANNYQKQTWTSIIAPNTTYTRYLINNVWGNWTPFFDPNNATTDPSVGFGLMSMTTVSGFTVFKYLNGQMIAQGPVPTTPSIAANTQFTVSVAIPVSFPIGNVSLVGTLYPSVGNDFAIRNTQAPGSTAYLFCANGASAQTFSGNIMLVGRWK